MDYFAPLGLGLLAGAFFFSRASLWFASVYVAVEKRWTYHDGQAHRRRTLLWALPVVLLLHSGPWVIIVAVFAVVHVLTTVHSAGWNWFFGGFAATAGWLSGLAIVGVRRILRAHAGRYLPKSEA